MATKRLKEKSAKTKSNYMQVYMGEGSPEAIAKLMQKLYGRVEPKKRSLAQVHAIWIKTKERLDKNREIFRKIIREVVKLKKADKSGYHYFHVEKGDYTVRYRFHYDSNFKSYSYSAEGIDNEAALTRVEIIDKFTDLNDEILSALGKKFTLYDRMCLSHLNGRTFDVMWKMIESSLIEINGRTLEYFEKILTISIENCFYHVDMKAHGNGWVEYKWRGKSDQEVIKL